MSSELLHECESCGAVIHAHEDLFETHEMGEVYCKKCATVAIEDGEKLECIAPDGSRRGAEEAIARVILLATSGDCHSSPSHQVQEQGDEAHAYLMERDELAARVKELEATLENLHRLTGREVLPEDSFEVHGWEPIAVERLRLIGEITL